MKYRGVCDIVRFLMACLSFIVFTGLVCGCIAAQNYLFAAVFAALDAVYIYMAVTNISMIYIDEEKVEKRTLGKTILSFPWDAIEDAGLVKKNFVYFSKEKMTDDDRYLMCFDWPPKDKIYFRSGKTGIKTAELLWNRRGKLFVRYKPEHFKRKG